MPIDSSSFDNQNSDFSFEDIQELESIGATSVSYKVRILGKWHFLKRPKPEFADNPLYVAAFEKEFDLGYSLDHPNIVRYVSKGWDAQGIYLLTEYVDGLTLTEYLKVNPDLSRDKKEFRRIVGQICDALAYLHSHNIVHYDLKPDNILITRSGNNVKLIDLGFSYSDCYDAIACGSPSFTAPEQFGCPDKADIRSDVYALGKVAEFLFGHSNIPCSYKRIISKATSADINDRHSNAREFQKAIFSPKRLYAWMVLGFFIIVIALSLIIIFANKENSLNTSNKILNSHKGTTDSFAAPSKDTISVVNKQAPNSVGDASIATYKSVYGGGLDLQGVLDEFRLRIKAVIEEGYKDFFVQYFEATEDNLDDFELTFGEIREHNRAKIIPIHEDYSEGHEELTLPLNIVWREENDIIEKRAAEIYSRYAEKENIISRFSIELNTVYNTLLSPYADTLRGFKTKETYERGVYVVDSLSAICNPIRDSLIKAYTEIIPAYEDRFTEIAKSSYEYSLTRHYMAIEHYERHYRE